MKLVVMTKSTYFVEEDKIIGMLFEEGLDSLHISKRDTSPLYLERLLSLLPSEFHHRIIVHQHFYAKNEFALGGIHLDSAGAAVPTGYKGTVGRTCEDVMQLRAMKKQSDYFFLKNIHQPREATADRERVLADAELDEASRQGLLGRHVYAMGGITLADIPVLRERGFGGVVIRNDLWERFCIHSEQNFSPVVEYFRKLRALCQ
ncbi:thiamine phosphate synthase [Prevotella multiformis]|uniref:thiamine phosphate synthase n=1 Tax=Prevotella multiformis TaxID=282402 RepID=UPI003FA06B28